jgi:hypothetical protein
MKYHQYYTIIGYQCVIMSALSTHTYLIIAWATMGIVAMVTGIIACVHNE